jgi:cellulose synthase operon protein C
MTSRVITPALVAASLVALGLSLLAGPPAAAQVASDPTTQPAPQPLQQGVEVRMRGAAGEAAVDDGALRYYASRGERAKVDAEIARLRALHPGWEPPADLFREGPSVDERPLWALYDQGDYAAVRAEVARLERANPGWQAPAKLLELMAENEVRGELARLEAAGDWDQLVATAEAHPGQLDCGRIDNLWRLARAYHGLARPADALGTYARIIERCDDLDHRVATLEKAKELVSVRQLDRLFDLESKRAKSPAEAERIAELRAQLARSGPPAPLDRLYQKGAGVETADAAAPLVLQRKDADGAEKLGWIYYDAGRFEDARAWFERAQGWAPTAKRAEGLARAQAKLGHDQAVKTLAAAYPRQLGPLAADTARERLDRAFAARDHAAVLAASRGLDTPIAHNLRGWTFLRLQRPTEALLEFERVLDGQATPGSAGREAAYGVASTRLALGNLDDALQIADAYHLPVEQRQAIYAEVLARRAGRAFAAKDDAACVALLEERRGYAEPSRALLIQEAWARYHLGQKITAQRIFAQLDRVYGTPETAEGLRVTRAAIDHM